MGTISKNFGFKEFEATSYAEFKYQNVIKDFEVRDNIVELVETILQPLRDAWGGPIRISSGYRCPELNAKVGGVPTSAHTIGAAADLVPVNAPLDGFIDFAVRFISESGVPYDQLIKEKAGKAQWLHIGLKNLKGEQRKQILKIWK